MPVDATSSCKKKTTDFSGEDEQRGEWAEVGWREISSLQHDDLGVAVRDEAGA